MTLEEFIEGAKDHEDIMDMLKKMMDLTPVLVIIVEGREGWERSVPTRLSLFKIIIIISPLQKEKDLTTLTSPGRHPTCCCQSETLCDGLWLVVQPPGVPSLRSSSSQAEKQTRFWQRCLNTLMILFSSSDLHPPTRSTVTNHPKLSRNVQTQSVILNFSHDSRCVHGLNTFHYLLRSVCSRLCCSFLPLIFFSDSISWLNVI